MFTVSRKRTHRTYLVDSADKETTLSDACTRFVSAEEPGCSRFDFEYKMLNKIIELEQRLKLNEDTIAELQELIGSLSEVERGSTYVRWGKTQCPQDTSLVYSGYIAGKRYSEKGGGSDSLRLPSDPSWLNYTDGFNTWAGRVWGTEIDLETDFYTLFETNPHNQDMSCAVCKTTKSTSLLIPARNSCYPGWKLEYRGYLMTSYHDQHGPINHVCVDTDPDFVPNGAKSNDEHVLYPVEAVCGSLPCPPYVNGRELACVVCSV